eukprot:6470041-Amphidinium_carterae.1
MRQETLDCILQFLSGSNINTSQISLRMKQKLPPHKGMSRQRVAGILETRTQKEQINYNRMGGLLHCKQTDITKRALYAI